MENKDNKDDDSCLDNIDKPMQNIIDSSLVHKRDTIDSKNKGTFRATGLPLELGTKDACSCIFTIIILYCFQSNVFIARADVL